VARAEQEAGTNPLGLMFPSPRGTYWRSSNFARRVLAPAYLAAGWPTPEGRLDLAQPAPRVLHHRPVHLETRRHRRLAMAGHANVRVTLDMYVGTTAGVLDRARTATE
jgi:hypothetical protein